MTRTDGRVDVEALAANLEDDGWLIAADQVRTLGAERDALRADVRAAGGPWCIGGAGQAVDGVCTEHHGDACLVTAPGLVQQLAAAERARDELVVALFDVSEVTAALLDGEVCDHDVGICWCGARTSLENAREALARHRAGSGEESNV